MTIRIVGRVYAEPHVRQVFGDKDEHSVYVLIESDPGCPTLWSARIDRRSKEAADRLALQLRLGSAIAVEARCARALRIEGHQTIRLEEIQFFGAPSSSYL